MKKIISTVLKGLGIFSLLMVLVGVTWLVLQPKLPSDHSTLRDEFLLSEEYRTVADSSIEVLEGIIKDLELPSLSVAISLKDEIVWACTFGYADIKNEIFPDQKTRYRAGSVSKSMTGLVCAKLVENNQLNLDTSVFTYLEDFPEKQWDISLRHLSAHTGGIRHYANPGKPGFLAEQFSKHHYQSVEESLELFQNDHLLHPPGSDFEYSTHGYTLLSAAIEKAAGKDIITTMADNLWNVHGMTSTVPDNFTIEISNRAIPYTGIAGKMLHTEGPDPSYKWAGGGILTTPSDLVRMGSAFINQKIVGEVTAAELFTPIPLTDGSPNPQNYALGWRNDQSSILIGSSDTIHVRHHGGSSPGGSSFLLLIPDGKVAAASMTNYSLGNSWPLREATFKIAGAFRNASREYSKSENE